MALRIHFSNADSARVTLAEDPDPLWELLLALHVLQGEGNDPVFGAWRGRVRVTGGVRELFKLAPPRGYSPDFLTPAESSAGLEPGLEALLCTPRARLRAELSMLRLQPGPPPWFRALGDASRTALGELIGAMADFFRDAVRPYWSHIEKWVHRDRHARAGVLLGGGVDSLLSSLHPSLRWRAPVLELQGGHVTGDLRLNGRGLRLVPSFFCQGAPTVLADPSLPPVLVYPIAHDPVWLRRSGSSHRDADWAALAALLGPTRAQVLCATATGRTTTELAGQVSISPASASYHASILRQAGLVDTQRTGTAVRHTLTTLGEELLGRQRRLAQSAA